MAVLRVYYGQMLEPKLQSLYHELRTVRTRHSSVGVDMPPEWFNKDLKADVMAGASEEQILQYTRRYNFTHVVKQGLLDLIRDPEAERERVMNDMESTVLKIKKFFYDNIGGDWAEASEVNAESEQAWHRWQSASAMEADAKERRQAVGGADQRQGVIRRLRQAHDTKASSVAQVGVGRRLPQQDVIVD